MEKDIPDKVSWRVVDAWVAIPPCTLLALSLIVTFSAHIFTNAILKNMKKMKIMNNEDPYHILWR